MRFGSGVGFSSIRGQEADDKGFAACPGQVADQVYQVMGRDSYGRTGRLQVAGFFSHLAFEKTLVAGWNV